MNRSSPLPSEHAPCFETLGNKLRMEILGELGRRPMNVNELATAIGAERSRVSHALQQLRRCRLVLATKEGREVIYGVNTRSPVFANKKGTFFELVEKHARECRNCSKCGR